MESVQKILQKDSWSRDDLVILLSADETGSSLIYDRAAEIRKECVGNSAYFRGLIEYSNHCMKNCFYCGIRSANTTLARYTMTDDEVLQAARFALKNGYASIVLQSGERTDEPFASKIEQLIREVHQVTGGKLHVTLSLGEQSLETYQSWFEAGAHRYLLRIEVSDAGLYSKLHPEDGLHSFPRRMAALKDLRAIGYQTGTGVMIGLPFQTIPDLADDLVFFRDIDIDMVGMGPYIEHPNTPLYAHRHLLPPLRERFSLSLKMIALLRIMMKDINIAAATALQAIDPFGREQALRVGANVIMPNLTPVKYRQAYQLYANKPCLDEDAAACKGCLETRIRMVGNSIAYGAWGDSVHYKRRRASLI